MRCVDSGSALGRYRVEEVGDIDVVGHFGVGWVTDTRQAHLGTIELNARQLVLAVLGFVLPHL